MIEYVLIAEYGAYFNDYTTGYHLTYIKERAKRILLYYDDNITNFIEHVVSYYAKNGFTVEVGCNGYTCSLDIEVTNNRNVVLKTFSAWKLLEIVGQKRNMRKKEYESKLKELFNVGDTNV